MLKALYKHQQYALNAIDNTETELYILGQLKAFTTAYSFYNGIEYEEAEKS
jgi:hypothetical protein